MSTSTYHEESVQGSYALQAIKHHLHQSLKQHLLQAIDSELDSICQSAIEEHIRVSMDKQYNPATLSTNYLYSFVQEVVQTVVKDTVVTKVR